MKRRALFSLTVFMAGCGGSGSTTVSPQNMPIPQAAVAGDGANSTYCFTIHGGCSPLPPYHTRGHPPPEFLPTATPIATARPTPTPTSTPTSGSQPTNPVPIPPGPVPTPILLLDGSIYLLTNTGGFGAWLPTANAVAFLYPIEYGFGGTGQKIETLGNGIPSSSDLAAYFQGAGLPTTPTVNSFLYQNGDTPNYDNSETTLDAETLAGLAPYATIDVVELPDLLDQTIVGALSSSVASIAPNIISMSFGGCENEAFSTAIHNIAQEAVATGVTLVASAGDQGPVCDSNGDTGVEAPASDPNVVAVGGSEDLGSTVNTLPAIDAALRNPAVWNDLSSGCTGNCVGGGGVSTIWSIPSYQYAPGIVSTAHSSTMRNVPDISLPAGGVNGPDAFFYNGSWQAVGGTSWAAPEFAAMQAEINQQCIALGGGSRASALADLYRVFYQAPSAFIDVTSGFISYPTTSLTYSAGPGYDNASGLGLPLGEEIAVQDGC